MRRAASERVMKEARAVMTTAGDPVRPREESLIIFIDDDICRAAKSAQSRNVSRFHACFESFCAGKEHEMMDGYDNTDDMAIEKDERTTITN